MSDRIVLRGTPTDHAMVAAIASDMRRSGYPFVTRADAVRHALRLAAERAEEMAAEAVA